MKQTIKLQNIFGTDLYTRSRAAEIRSSIKEQAEEVVLDFEGVNFISRSFADEVCNIIDDMNNKQFNFINQIEVVKTMLSKVQISRSQERKRGISNPRIYKFNDMESLSKFLLNM